jgi:hypothetical protein
VALLYRAMIPDEDGGPAVGDDRNMLGLRPGEVDLSVFVDAQQIPNPIRPKSTPNAQGEPGMNAETVLFTIDEAELAASKLALGAVGKRTHAGIRPAGACDTNELQRRIAETRPKWRKA